MILTFAPVTMQILAFQIVSCYCVRICVFAHPARRRLSRRRNQGLPLKYKIAITTRHTTANMHMSVHTHIHRNSVAKWWARLCTRVGKRSTTSILTCGYTWGGGGEGEWVSVMVRARVSGGGITLPPSPPPVQHLARGVLSMMNDGPDANTSRFMITFARV